MDSARVHMCVYIYVHTGALGLRIFRSYSLERPWRSPAQQTHVSQRGSFTYGVPSQVFAWELAGKSSTCSHLKVGIVSETAPAPTKEHQNSGCEGKA